MSMLVQFFGGGKTYLRPQLGRCDFTIQGLAVLKDSVIPHFDLYPLCNIKELDYQDFKLGIAMVSDATVTMDKAKLQEIISGMNSKRMFK